MKPHWTIGIALIVTGVIITAGVNQHANTPILGAMSYPEMESKSDQLARLSCTAGSRQE